MLIANATILYPRSKFAGDAYKEGWEVKFTMHEEIKDGKAKVSFGNLSIYVPTTLCSNSYAGQTSSYEKELTAEEMEKVRPIFQALPDQLESYLKGPDTKADW